MRRSKPFSTRPKILTEAQEADLLGWWNSPRTAPQKARALGISTSTLYNYVHGKHKPRRQQIDIDSMAETLIAMTSQFHDEYREMECSKNQP